MMITVAISNKSDQSTLNVIITELLVGSEETVKVVQMLTPVAILLINIIYSHPSDAITLSISFRISSYREIYGPLIRIN